MFTTGALAQVQKLPEPQELLVIAEEGTLMIGDDPSSKVPQGTVLTTTHQRGPWNYIPSLKGWMHDSELVSYSEAIESCTETLQENPSAQLHHLRGIAFIGQKDFLRAVRDLETAYDLGESSISLHFNMALCYRNLEQFPAAIRQLTLILDNFPDEGRPYQERGDLFLEQGDYQAALRDFDKALELAPRSPELRNARGVALRLLGRYEDAIASYSKAIEDDPKFAEAYLNRGYARKSLNQDQGALGDYDQAIKLDPTNDAKNELSWLLATSPQESVRNPERALALANDVSKATNNQNGEYLDTLAAALAVNGKFEAAVEAAALAETLLAGNPGVKQVRERRRRYEKKQTFIETPEERIESVRTFVEENEQSEEESNSES
ncbi:MAG: tetratricopeptide repeat protein [Planctomycetaceae bacterium]|nr:tetratricopeptide repeat protein [Planctomycetaceae bacterium]